MTFGAWLLQLRILGCDDLWLTMYPSYEAMVN